MRIGILGSGLMGGKLGTIFARAGHDVVFSYSHSETKLKRLARDAGGRARAGTPAEAARDADALLLAVHWSRVDDVLKKAGDVSGKVIVSCSLPMNANDTDLAIGHKSSGAERLAKKRPKARVVSAFNTVPSEVLFSVFDGAGGGRRPSLVYCGDDKKAKKVAAQLISDVGFEPLDAGPLRIARYTEPSALLVAQLAYEGDRGPAMAYRFEWFEERK
ncbi:MAG TPA: NAD(P)-binding domain-containing protein [Gemmatimonadaceae bacterium]|nr:NAD(P)-binding domain-containing protein [Gemmatimonadaceae bacterium]